MEIVTGDVGVDFLHQLADAAERSAPNCLLSDEAEPALPCGQNIGSRWLSIHGEFDLRLTELRSVIR